MDLAQLTISEEWIRKKLNITHDNLEDIKTLSLAGTYQEKISYLGNALHKFTRLKELDLSRNSLISLDGLEHCKHLEKLNLYYNNISSLKELERLRFNSVLNELDLRLNPITKEENDYRLYLIHILPSLRVFDDRAIRDSERQMAITYFEQKNSLISSSVSSSLSSASSSSSDCNSKPNVAIMSRVKSVSNIAKRSAGITDQEDKSGNYPNMLNLRMHDNDYYTSNNQPQIEQYSPRTNFESNSYNTLSNQPQQDGRDASYFNKSKSCSMQNLRAINSENINMNQNNNIQANKAKSVHFNEVASYHDLNSYRSSSDNNLNTFEESDAFNNFKSRGSFTPNPFYDNNGQQLEKQPKRKMSRDLIDPESNETSTKQITKLDEQKSTQLFLLLDLVDRYWNGSKSLHQNQKFIGAANQLMIHDDNYSNNDCVSTLQSQIRVLQEENKRLQNQLIQKTIIRSENGETSTELQHKNLLAEIDILKKKLITSQEENKKLQKEFVDKSEKIQKEYSLETFESQNGSMKREVEIMRIKLKQYEQLQQLTGMLQESHKSLVTTNEHLLQEISNHKRVSHNRTHYSNSNSNNDLYSPNQLTQQQLQLQQQQQQQQREIASLVYMTNNPPNNGVPKANGNHTNKPPKQHFEQINGRYSYSVVK